MSQLHNASIQSHRMDGTLNGYQRAAQAIAIYPGKGSFLGLLYATLKLNGEAGEIAEKVGKLVRDEGFTPSVVGSTEHESAKVYWPSLSLEQKSILVKELGDVLWYVAAVAAELGYSLDQIAYANIQKLKDRQDRGTLSGSGDNR